MRPSDGSNRRHTFHGINGRSLDISSELDRGPIIIWIWVMMKSSMTAMDRYRTMTQTTMMNSTAEVGFEVRCFLRLLPRRGAAFSAYVTRRRVNATGLVPDDRR